MDIKKKIQHIIIIDFEVLCNAKFWMCCMKDLYTQKEHVIINNADEFKRVFYKNLNSIWVGYNIKGFDFWIMRAILTGYDVFELTEKIIGQGIDGWKISPILNRQNINFFEIGSQQRSLKELELFMGESIIESDIPFDLETYPSEEEIKILTHYCMHDVRMTYKVFKYLEHEFEAQKGLIEYFGLDLKAFTRTKAQLSSIILNAKKPKYERNDEFEFKVIDVIQLNKYNYIKEWYMNPFNRDYKSSLDTKVYGVETIFGWGGLHGARGKYNKEGIIINSDVASFYPSIMIEYNLLSRNVQNPEKFAEIKKTRLEFKAKKDKKANSLKIVLNGTFGASKDKFNDLYDPQMGNGVCVNGQLLLLDLIEKVEEALAEKAELIQCNTDGVMFWFENEEAADIYKGICEEWSARTKMDLEHDYINKVIQKDVNNYIFRTNDGKIKCKGAYLKDLSPIDNDLPIINKALKDKLLKDIPIEETINNAEYLIDFQKCIKLTGKYIYALHNNERVPLKVLRVFASKNMSDGPVLKVKKDSGTAEKIGNTPERAFIVNENIQGVKVPENLDRNWYIDLANKRLEEFIPKEKEYEYTLLEMID